MATQEQRDFMPGYFFTHDALRRDLLRMKRFVARFPAVQTADIAMFEKWFLKVHEPMIMTHHHAEDKIFIPKMVALVPSFVMAAKEITHEHELLDEHCVTLKRAFTAAKMETNSATLNALSVAVYGYADLVVKHLDDEEPVVAETVMRELSKEQFLAIEKAHQQHGTMKDLSTGIPWIMDGISEQDFAHMKKGTPFFIVLLFSVPYLLFWKPSYSRLVKHLPS